MDRNIKLVNKGIHIDMLHGDIDTIKTKVKGHYRK